MVGVVGRVQYSLCTDPRAAAPVAQAKTALDTGLPFQSTKHQNLHIWDSSLLTQVKYHQENHIETEEISEFEYGKEEHSI